MTGVGAGEAFEARATVDPSSSDICAEALTGVQHVLPIHLWSEA